MTRKRLIPIIAVLLAAFLAAVFALSRGGMPLWRSDAKTILYGLGQPEGSTGYGDVQYVSQTGDVPETLTALYQAPVKRESVLAFYERACWRLHLKSPPAKSLLIKRPDLTCAGEVAGVLAGVTVKPACNQTACEVLVKVEAYRL